VTDLAERRGMETDVYQPAEDSHLLAETALDWVTDDHRVLEVGTGSGVVAASIAAETAAEVVASDLNPHACQRARERGLQVVRGDLVAPFADGAFDVVAFNPPYLPTDPDVAGDDWMEVALSGGEDGRAVVEPFVATVGRVLAPGGVALLLVSTLTGLEAVESLASDAGLTISSVAEESFPYETLHVLALAQTDSPQSDNSG
jgi:release factor glutamine methyltransferase